MIKKNTLGSKHIYIHANDITSWSAPTRGRRILLDQETLNKALSDTLIWDSKKKSL
jgi:hypothetical protein